MSPPPAKNDPNEEPSPRIPQQRIVKSGEYPMRVLAGAGTGKTFTMVRKIEHLIDEHNVSPDRILALTFTNKAADSMREKLNEKLGAPGYDVNAYTYHSICHDILREYAYHATIDPQFEVVNNADRTVLIHEALDEITYRFTSPEVYGPDSHADGAAGSLLKFISTMKSKGIPPSTIETFLGDADRLLELEALVDRIVGRANETVRVSWRAPSADRLEEMRDGLAALQQSIADERSTLSQTGVEQSVATYLGGMEETCTSLAELLETEEASIIDGEHKPAFRLPAYLFGTYSGPPSGIPDSMSVTLTGKLRSFVEECQEAADLVAGYTAYEERLHDASLVDFADLIGATLDLLENPDIRAEISGQYDYVFCDEFQDTDAVQFELVDQLADDDKLFVVGDDDQAIYEWRGAAVENIGHRLEERYETLIPETLEENFRSKQPILDVANNVIAQLEARGSKKELTAVGDAADASDGIATITAAEDDEEQAEQIATAIGRLLSGSFGDVDETYEAGDIALLVRKNRHAKPIVRALEERGIPYQLAGGLAADSVGVETVLAYFKALANPADEVSLNRVLTMRYRLHDADIRRLNTASDSLSEALQSLPLDQFREPERVRRAREDFQALCAKREIYSVARLFRELKEQTNIHWYLSPQERRDLRTLESLIDSFGEGALQPALDESFLELLSLMGSLDDSIAGVQDQAETVRDAVNIMTVHKSKGLEFPVVFLPNLSADQWEPSTRSYDTLGHTLEETAATPLDQDFEKRDEYEARRIFHVAMTRAEEQLVLVGRHADDGGVDDGDLSLSFIDSWLPKQIPWRATGASFPIWQEITAGLPPEAADWTDQVAVANGSMDPAISVNGEPLPQSAARDHVLSLARGLLNGDLDSVPPTTAGFAVEAIVADGGPMLRHRHSYTSLEKFSQCSRRYYLDYLVRAFEDPHRDAIDSNTGSIRDMGILFHDTAEVAAKRGSTSLEGWNDICDELASQENYSSDIADQAKNCIDRYFRTEASSWRILSAERSFTLNISGHTITGKIDAVCRNSAGNLAVLDYKATTKKRSLSDNLQLPIYLLACQELFEERIDEVGYVYVGSIGPGMNTRSFSDDELDQCRKDILAQLQEAEDSTFEDFTAGDHCQWCPHRSLPCSQTR